MNVLIVDDHPIVAEYLRAATGRAMPEASVRTANTLEDALASMSADPAQLVLLDLGLSGWNCEYTNANDAASALGQLLNAAAENKRFSAVLIDREALEIDAGEFAMAVRTSQQIQSTALLLLTTRTDRHDDFYKAGYVSVIQKPVDKPTLFNALHAACTDIIHNDNTHLLHDHYLQKGKRLMRGLRILVADDNSTNQLVATKILEHAGHIPHIVNNGQEALDALETEHFDILIMDMQMPVMGGIEAAKIYNYSVLGRERIPIIILTANATTEAKQLCDEANVDAYLTKPIEAKKLLSTINSIYRIRRPIDQLIVTYDNVINISATTEPNYRTLDKEIVNGLISLSDDGKFVTEIVNGYSTDSTNLLAGMEAALSRRDYKGYGELLHALKGSAGSVGAEQLYKECKNFPNVDSDPGLFIKQLKQLNKLHKETLNDLHSYIESTIAANTD